MTSTHSLPAPERAERYREFAAQTLRLAQTAKTPEIMATYLSLSQCWKSLADQADRLSSDFPEGWDENMPIADTDLDSHTPRRDH